MPPGTWRSVTRLRKASWPRGFALIQFPNPPLIVALIAGGIARATDGAAHRGARAVFFVALSIWAYEEARRGDNWFRRGLGAAGLLYVILAVAHATDSRAA